MFCSDSCMPKPKTTVRSAAQFAFVYASYVLLWQRRCRVRRERHEVLSTGAGHAQRQAFACNCRTEPGIPACLRAHITLGTCWHRPTAILLVCERAKTQRPTEEAAPVGSGGRRECPNPEGTTARPQETAKYTLLLLSAFPQYFTKAHPVIVSTLVAIMLAESVHVNMIL